MSESNGQVEVLRFTRDRQKIPVEIDGETYTIEDLTPAELAAYRNEVQRRMKLDRDGQPQSYYGMEACLLCRTLRGPDGTLVSEETIQKSFPSGLLVALWLRARRLNGLAGEENIEPKKN